MTKQNKVKNKNSSKISKIIIGILLLLVSLIIIFYGGFLTVISFLSIEKSISFSSGITQGILGLLIVIASIIGIIYSIKIMRSKN